MRSLLEASAFNGTPISTQLAKSLIAEGQALIAEVNAAAAGS